MPVDPLNRESEPYSQYGNISAEGIQRLLGTPHLDALHVLIRETVQNSWDAGKDTPGTVEYRIRLRELSDQERSVLRDIVFNNLPEYDRNPDHAITDTLASNRIAVIEICDFGTTGLGGPTSPEQVPQDGDSPDFVDFMRNIGSPRDTVFGGGTYGYGKSCLYAFSQCRSILVDSVTRVAGASTRRFMGCRVASRYDIKNGSERGRYTGRHWWGRRQSDNILEPLTGKDAEDLSRSLGICERGPADLGTTIVVLAPEFDFANMKEAAQKAVSILLWYCWPKMIASDNSGQPAMTFSVEVNGELLTVPHPDHCPPLDLFAMSLRAVRADSDEAVAIRSLRPARHLGRLHIQRGVKGTRLADFAGEENSLFPLTSSHVALMRPAELVVKYAVGEPLPSDDVEWGGVFVCSDDSEIEQAFAAAEPPAHDDWDPQSLPKGPRKTYVRVALRRIREAMNAVTAHLPASRIDDGVRLSLAPVADVLGATLTSVEGQRLGSPRQTRRRRTRGRQKGVTVSRPQFVGHDVRDGQECALFEVTLDSSAPIEILLSGHVRILKDGGGADRDDARGEQPAVTGWQQEAGEEFEGSRIEVEIHGEQKWLAVVAMPAGKAISLVATAEVRQ